MRARLARALALLLAGVVVGAGCGPGGGRSRVESDVGPLSVPALFGGVVGHYTAVVATSTHLVGVGGMVPTIEGFDRVRFGGEVVDLGSGVVSAIDSPVVDGQPVDVLAEAADDDQVVAFGNLCGEQLEDGFCVPSTIAAAVLDPGSGEWRAMPLPAEVAGQRLANMSSVQVRGPGSFVAVVNLDVEGEVVSWVLAFDDGVWRAVAKVDDHRWAKADCVTEESMFLLRTVDRDPEDDGRGPDGLMVEFSLVELDLGTGELAEVELPPLAPGFGGAGVVMGCGPEHPVIASGMPGEDGTVLAFDGT